MSSHSVARRIAFNTLAQGIGRLGNLVLNLIAMLALIRYLGAAGYGSYIFIINFTTLFGLIGDFGISQVAVREISRHTEKANSLLTMSTTLRLGLSSLAMLICVVSINSIEASVEERLGVLLASGVFLVQALGSLNSIFQANLAMQYDSLTNFISRAVDTSLILLFIAQGRGLLPFLATPLLSGLVYVLLIAAIAIKRFQFRPVWDATFLPMLLRESWPIGLASVPVIVFFRADSLLLNRLAGSEATGIYAAAQRPIEYLLVIVSPLLINSVFPLLSSYWPVEKERFIQLYRRAFDIQMCFIVLATSVAVVFSEQIVELLYTNQFADSALPLRVLSVSAIFMFIGAYVARMLIAVNRQRMALLNESVGAVVNIGFNLWFIPRLGATGSALAMLITVTVVGVMHMWAIERVIHVWPRANTMVYIGLAGITCSCLMWLTGQQYWWLGMLCGSFAYPFLLVALRVFSVDEVLSLVRRKSESQA